MKSGEKIRLAKIQMPLNPGRCGRTPIVTARRMTDTIVADVHEAKFIHSGRENLTITNS